MNFCITMPKFKAIVSILVALAITGCAHQPEVVETSVAPDPPPAAKKRRSSFTPPEEDPRYEVPGARSRALTIFLGSQNFEYVEDGQVFASGEVTSGSAQHPTPSGSFRVQSKNKHKRSGSYTNYYNQPTPMPYSLQFFGPYFIHEGYMPGHADSHGCVRLHYEDARLLFTRMKVGDPVHVKKSGTASSANRRAGLFPVF